MPHVGSIILPALCCTLANALIETQPIRLHLVADHNLIVCACDKCGTTSLYNFLYEALFGFPWSFDGRPFIQNLDSPRWKNTFSYPSPHQWSRIKHRIAVVRDPQERILAGWKSKLACNAVGPVNASDREMFVPEIYRLAKVSPVPPCVSFDTYVRLLKKIHEEGNAHLLNPHFLPQQYGCFRHVPVSQWTLVAPIGARSLEKAMQDVFRAPDLEMPKGHSTKNVFWVPISAEIQEILDNITRDEYAALGDSLRHADAVVRRGSAVLECASMACGIPCDSGLNGTCVTW